MLTIAMSCLYFILFYIVVNHESKRDGSFATMYVFGIGVFVYFVAIPLQMTLTGVNSYGMGILITRLSGDERSLVLFMSLLAFSGFYLGLRFAKFHMCDQRTKEFPLGSACALKRMHNVVLWLAIVSAGVIFGYYHNEIISMGNYSVSYASRYESPLLSYLIVFFALSGSLMVSIYLVKRRFVSVLLGLLCFLAIVLFGKTVSYKIAILPAFFALASGVIYTKRYKTIKVFLLTTLIIPFVLLLVFVFSFLRAGVPLSKNIIMSSASNVSFTVTDPAGPMDSLAYYLNKREPLYLGATYVHSLSLFIPKLLWPNRPLSLAEGYARARLSNWSPGQGLAFSPLAESYMNFGVLGAFIQFFIFGLIWGFIWRLAKQYVFKNQESLYVIFYQVVGYTVLFLSFRTSMIGIFKFMFIYLVPFSVVLYLARRLRFRPDRA